jgi:hypothetical protein
MAEEHYIVEDSIIASVALPNPCEIHIDITDERVSLTIGQRDFGWKRGHPDCTDAGTMIDPPVADQDG